MAGRLISDDGSTRQYFHDLGDRHVIQKVSDPTAIIEANKRAYNDAGGRMGEFVMVGRVDPVVMERWCREDGINYLAPENIKPLLKKLDQRENRCFKTHPGKFA
jgi:hypothetical protein